jgi:hypothetical protein
MARLVYQDRQVTLNQLRSLRRALRRLEDEGRVVFEVPPISLGTGERRWKVLRPAAKTNARILALQREKAAVERDNAELRELLRKAQDAALSVSQRVGPLPRLGRQPMPRTGKLLPAMPRPVHTRRRPLGD